MSRLETNSIDYSKLSEVVWVTAKYHGGAFTVKTCDYLGISPGNRGFLKLLEEHGAYLEPDRKSVERFCDEEIQELVKLAQDGGNEYAKMRITKLLEPLINKCYRRSEGDYYSREDFFMAAVIRLYEYIDTYQKRNADFCYLLKKRLIGLNAELRDECNPFSHGLGQYLGKIRKFINEFEGRYGVTPSAQMIAEETGLADRSVENCLWLLRANETVSLDTPIRKEGEKKLFFDGFSSIMELVVDPKTETDYVESHRREFIIEEIKKLPALEQAVVFWKFGFYGEPLSREKVCEKLNITRGIYEKVLANAIDILCLTLSDYGDVI